MKFSFLKNKKIQGTIFILLLVICLAVLIIDLYLFWENPGV
jgi:hypothetical protein